jgi:hypothetical protein
MQEKKLGELGKFTKEKSLRNHRLRLFIENGKIVLDNPSINTYHTKALCQRYDLVRPENSCAQQGQPRGRFA